MGAKSPPPRQRRPAGGRSRAAPPPPRRGWWLRFCFWSGLLGFLALGILCAVYGFWASTFDIEAVKEMPSRTTVYDFQGNVFSRLQGENRVVVPLEKVSRYFLDALLAREDSRFYSHFGIDPIGIARAVVKNSITRAASQGASTLTQQLARNSFAEKIGAKKSVHRKLLEAFVSLRIEQRYTKGEILEFYINRIYFGEGVYGIEQASLAFFGKHAADLSLGEAATIAGVIRAPTYSSPLQHPDRAERARDAVLDRMVAVDKITAAEAAAAKSAKLHTTSRRTVQAQENYAMDAVQRDLYLLLTDEQRAQGGLKVFTTLDPKLQRAAEQSLDEQLTRVETRPGFKHQKKSDFTAAQKEDEAETPYLQGAAVVIDNASGGIRALVGGRDYAESKFNRALNARRQVGSTFKPFVYAAAMAHGLLPGTMVDDSEIHRGEVRGAPGWTPDNSDDVYKGPLKAEEGLIQSRNTMSVRVGQMCSLEEISKLAARTGLDEVPQRPSIYLGAFEDTLMGVTSAYAVLASQGIRRQTFIIERIEDAAGETIYRAAHVQTAALDAGVCWLTTTMLAKVMERGTADTAKSLGWSRPSAGKTGTTNDFNDAWFVGYTGSLTTGVWVGFDKPKTIIPKGYGAALALPVWVEIMKGADAQRYPAGPLKPGVNLQRVGVCSAAPGFATGACDRAGTSYTAELPASLIPHTPCRRHGGGGPVHTDVSDATPTKPAPPGKEGPTLQPFSQFMKDGR